MFSFTLPIHLRIEDAYRRDSERNHAS